MKYLVKILIILTSLLFVSLNFLACQLLSQKEEASITIEDNQNASIQQIDESTVETSSESPTDAIEEIIRSLTLEEKVSQLFLLSYPEPAEVEIAQHMNIGGFIFYSKDFDNLSREGIIARNNNLITNSIIPPLLAVDEEGGVVNRISLHSHLRPTPFRSPREIYQVGGLPAIVEDSQKKCRFLSELGINFNLAPVADISNNPTDFIYDRSLGEDPEITSEYVKAVIGVMHQQKVISALKHFPGYGGNQDTHTQSARDYRDFEELKNSDLKPFIAGIEAGAPVIMVTHTIMENIESNVPASISRILHDKLRDELHFSGVIMTDDLSMVGIGNYTDSNEVAVLAILAGNDLICSPFALTQIPYVIQAVEKERIPIELIDEAVKRILKIKMDYGLIN